MFLLLAIVALTTVANGQFLVPEASADAPGGRIVGGVKTTIELHPHQVSLQTLGLFHKCGGAIISEYHVLTAGHCVKSLLPGLQKALLRVRAGTSFWRKGGSRHTIAEIHLHEGYRLQRNGAPLNDIALIRVKKPFKLDASRRPVDLYRAGEQVRNGSVAVVSGWGSTGGSEFFLSGQLRTTSVPIVDKSACAEAYRASGGIGEGQICAGYLGKGGKDSCQGDSGGPLTVDGRLAGIVSYGSDCASKDFPGVYTEIAHYYDWIMQKSGLSGQ